MVTVHEGGGDQRQNDHVGARIRTALERQQKNILVVEVQ